jgi:hypothetical protein
MKVVLKSKYSQKLVKLAERRGDPIPDDKFEYFKKLIMDHLNSLDGEGDNEASRILKKAGLPVGTVRIHKNGIKYIKLAPGKWRPKYDSHSRGAKMAIAAIKRKINSAKTSKELMDIVMENRDRFSDTHGNPLPFVQDLSDYVRSRGDTVETAVEPKKPDKPKRGQAVAEGKESDNIEEGNDEKNTKAKQRIIDNLDTMAVPMDHQEFSKEAYETLFPDGKLNTPIGEVKIGKNQYEKLRDRDGGIRKRLIGAMYQTLSDPVVIIEEKNNNREAKIYIKSFRKGDNQDVCTVLSVTIEKDGDRISISTYRRKKRKVILKIKKAGGIVYEKTTLPSQTDHVETTPQSSLSPESGEKSSGDFEKIRKKYQSAKAKDGDEDEIQAGKEIIAGKWKLVEADTPTASHDESTFHKTPGFPANADGSSINDRDYEHFQANKEAVINIASEFDGRALKFDNPVIVTKDGIVISGNNRTMSSKIAARKGTDKQYIEALKKRAKKFGFTEEQVSQFKNPRVVFEVEHDGGYTTEQFAKFNESTKKTMGPTERAIKVSKIMKPETIEAIAGMIGEYDTIGDLYKDQKASQKLIKTFQDSGLIGQNAEGEFVENGVLTPAGKSFIETALLGSVVNEVNLRGFNRPGCLSIRQTMVRALAPLVENKGLSGYSINKEMNEAIDIAMQVAIEKDKFKSVEDWSRQQNFFESPPDRAVVELAKRLEGTQKSFADFIQEMNAGLKVGANGEADIFLGGVETKEQILGRFLGLKKSIMAALDFFRNRFMKKSDDYRQLAVEGIEPYSEKTDMLKYGEKAIAVDFDGVINSFKNGWKGPTETDEPVLSAAESIATLFHRGYKIIIFSTRASTEEGVKTIREYLLKHTEDPGMVEKIEITDKKPIAHIYIDDRAIPFTGDWEETLKQIDEFKPWTETEKSLTWSGHKLEDRYKVQGMDISIENKKGSVRSGTDKDGHEWNCKMHFDYGYIRGTVGRDKDHLDCYVGPDRESERVFIVHQNDPVTGAYDEDKVMLGFSSEEEARKAYLSQYDRPGFLGDIIEMGIEEFKETIFDENNKGRKIEGGSADEN